MQLPSCEADTGPHCNDIAGLIKIYERILKQSDRDKYLKVRKNIMSAVEEKPGLLCSLIQGREHIVTPPDQRPSVLDPRCLGVRRLEDDDIEPAPDSSHAGVRLPWVMGNGEKLDILELRDGEVLKGL